MPGPPLPHQDLTAPHRDLTATPGPSPPHRDPHRHPHPAPVVARPCSVAPGAAPPWRGAGGRHRHGHLFGKSPVGTQGTESGTGTRWHRGVMTALGHEMWWHGATVVAWSPWRHGAQRGTWRHWGAQPTVALKHGATGPWGRSCMGPRWHRDTVAAWGHGGPGPRCDGGPGGGGWRYLLLGAAGGLQVAHQQPATLPQRRLQLLEGAADLGHRLLLPLAQLLADLRHQPHGRRQLREPAPGTPVRRTPPRDPLDLTPPPCPPPVRTGYGRRPAAAAGPPCAAPPRRAAAR